MLETPWQLRGERMVRAADDDRVIVEQAFLHHVGHRAEVAHGADQQIQAAFAEVGQQLRERAFHHVHRGARPGPGEPGQCLRQQQCPRQRHHSDGQAAAVLVAGGGQFVQAGGQLGKRQADPAQQTGGGGRGQQGLATPLQQGNLDHRFQFAHRAVHGRLRNPGARCREREAARAVHRVEGAQLAECQSPFDGCQCRQARRTPGRAYATGEVGEGAFDARCEQARRFGGDHAAGLAVEQRRIQLPFQPRDGLGERGLGQIEVRRGRADAAVRVYRHHRVQVFQVQLGQSIHGTTITRLNGSDEKRS